MTTTRIGPIQVTFNNIAKNVKLELTPFISERKLIVEINEEDLINIVGTIAIELPSVISRHKIRIKPKDISINTIQINIGDKVITAIKICQLLNNGLFDLEWK